MKAKDAPVTMAADGQGAEGAAGDAIAPKPAAEKAKTNAPANSPVRTAANRAVTVTGCLEKNDDGYRLKDTSGLAAPKSRSWKSGFLRKGSASVDVVSASHAVALNSEVGHRVAVTGPLTDREMRAESVQRVATSCKAN
jgi:hypothetical protein